MIHYEDMIKNHSLQAYFGEEDADSFIDEEKTADEEYLGDYNLAIFIDEDAE